MSMTNTALKAAFSESTEEVWLVFLEIDHPALTGGPLRLVRNSADVVRGGHTFTALMFDILLPGQHDRQASMAQVSLPNVDRKITDAIRPLAASNADVKVSLYVTLASDPAAIQHGPWDLVLRNVSWDAEWVQGDLYPVIELDQTWPDGRMDNARFPGLYAG